MTHSPPHSKTQRWCVLGTGVPERRNAATCTALMQKCIPSVKELKPTRDATRTQFVVRSPDFSQNRPTNNRLLGDSRRSGTQHMPQTNALAYQTTSPTSPRGVISSLGVMGLGPSDWGSFFSASSSRIASLFVRACRVGISTTNSSLVLKSSPEILGGAHMRPSR